MKKGEKCKEGYKQCGLLDSLNNTMCIKEDETCPINLIVLNKEESCPNDGQTYHTIKINDEYIHYTNEAIDNPIVVKFALNNTRNVISLFPYEPDKNENLESYDFFTCSFINSNLNYSLYQYLSNDTLYRPYIGISDECLIDNESRIENRATILNSLESIQWGYLTCSIILFFADLAVLGYAIYQMNEIITILNYSLIRIPLYLLLIALFILNLISLIKIKKIQPKVNCYDEVTNYEINYFVGDANSNMLCVINLIAIPLLLIETNIAMIIFKNSDARKENKLNQDTMIEAKDMSVNDKL